MKINYKLCNDWHLPQIPRAELMKLSEYLTNLLFFFFFLSVVGLFSFLSLSDRLH
jgi:hypothetical protein